MSKVVFFPYICLSELLNRFRPH